MAEYIVEIKGSNSIEDIQELIADEESVGAEFLRCNLSYHDHRITNLVTFKEIVGVPDKPLMLSRGGATASDGMKLIWAGVVLAKGTNVAVTAFR